MADVPGGRVGGDADTEEEREEEEFLHARPLTATYVRVFMWVNRASQEQDVLKIRIEL